VRRASSHRRSFSAIEVRLAIFAELFAIFFLEVVAAFDENRALV
jgi:hypothetical protein